MLQEGGDLVEGDGVGEGVGANLFTAEGGEEGATVEGKAEVAGDTADVGAFAAADAEVELWQVRGYGALRMIVEVVCGNIGRGARCIDRFGYGRGLSWTKVGDVELVDGDVFGL